MNHNPHDLKRGDEVIMDERHLVKINNFTPLFLIATVEEVDKISECSDNSFQVMTYRLTPKPFYNSLKISNS